MSDSLKDSLAQASIQIASDLGKALAVGSDSTAFSSFCLLHCLLLTASVVSGNARDEILSYLRISEPYLFNGPFRAALDELTKRASIERGAGFFLDSRFEIIPEKAKQIADVVDGIVRTLSVPAVNSFVASSTHNQITNIVDDVSNDLSVLVSVLYFKGKWAIQFPKEATRPEPFYPFNSKSFKTNMMKMPKKKIAYRSSGTYDAIYLRYEESSVRAVVALPKEKSPEALNSVFSEIQGTTKEDLDAFRSKEVILSMPRFEISHTIIGPLKAYMQKHFPGLFSGDFSMEEAVKSAPAAAISDVIQKIVVKVDEEGTVAAAATAFRMRCLAVMKPEMPIVFTVDRPFVFSLIDNEGVSLFSTKVTTVGAATGGKEDL